MRSKRAVGLAVASTLLISVIVGVLGLPASATDPAVLTVPSGDQRGVVNVTATADAVLYPYVQVGLVVGEITSVNSIPTGQIDGIDPAPVLNVGAPVALQVPTWGVTGQFATFVLMGCTSNNKATCTSPLAAEPRPILQTNLASASVDLPALPVFVPEQQVSITTDNPGGGDMFAGLVELGTEQAMPDSGTATFTAYGADFGEDTVAVRRCSALFSDPAYCEFVEDADISWVREFVTEQADAHGYGLGFVTTDPSIPATSVELTFTAHTLGLPYSLWWDLRDANDDLVAGPVQIAQQSTAANFTSTVSPIAHAVGAGIPDGDYSFVVYGSTSKGALTKQTLQSATVSVLNDPPLELAPLALVDRVQRPKDSAVPGNTRAYYSVAALTDRPGAPAEFVIKNAAGAIVYDEQQQAPCAGYEAPNNCLSEGLAWDFRVPVGPDNTLLFPPGKYSVSAKIPDQFGRLAPVGLGALQVQELARVRKVVKVSPGERIASNGRLMKAKFKLPLPELKESYYDLSRTRIMVGFKGSGRDRDRQVSCATTAGRLAWKPYVNLASSGDQVCRLVNKSSFRGLPTRGVRVRAQVSHGAVLKVKWIKAIYFFRGYVTPAS